MHLGKLVLGAIGLYQGLKALGAAFADDKAEEESNSGPAEVPEAARRLPVPKISAGKVKTYKVSPLRDRKSAKERMDIIIPIIQKSRRDPKVRAYAVKVLSQRCGKTWCVPEKNWKREVEVLFLALRERYRYVHDPVGVDHFSSARKTLELGGEDCDGAVILLSSVLGAIGVETRAVIIEVKYQGRGDGWHIYLEAKIQADGTAYWMPLDLTVQRPPGWEPPAHMIKQRFVFPVP